jgi:hypothetical protein
MSQVRVRAHRREQNSGVKREARKTKSDLKTGAHGVHQDLKTGYNREFKRRPTTKFHGVSNEGESKVYYIRGVDDQGHVAAGTLYASSEEDARSEYRSLYPGHKIVQLNERK